MFTSLSHIVNMLNLSNLNMLRNMYNHSGGSRILEGEGAKKAQQCVALFNR